MHPAMGGLGLGLGLGLGSSVIANKGRTRLSRLWSVPNRIKFRTKLDFHRLSLQLRFQGRVPESPAIKRSYKLAAILSLAYLWRSRPKTSPECLNLFCILYRYAKCRATEGLSQRDCHVSKRRQRHIGMALKDVSQMYFDVSQDMGW